MLPSDVIRVRNDYVYRASWDCTALPCHNAYRPWCLVGETWDCHPEDCQLRVNASLRQEKDVSAEERCKGEVTQADRLLRMRLMWGIAPPANLITWWRDGVGETWTGHTRDVVFTQPCYLDGCRLSRYLVSLWLLLLFWCIMNLYNRFYMLCYIPLVWLRHHFFFLFFFFFTIRSYTLARQELFFCNFYHS